MIKLARKYDLLLICDDVYNTLNYVVDDKNPDKFLPSPPRLFSYDDKNDPDYKGKAHAAVQPEIICENWQQTKGYQFLKAVID